MHNFNDFHTKFSLGTYCDGASWISSTPSLEWVYLLHYILPYLEQSAYHNAIGAGTWSLPNPWINGGPWAPLANISSATLLGPSDPGFALTTHGAPVGPPMARSNYLGFFSGTKDSHNLVPKFSC